MVMLFDSLPVIQYLEIDYYYVKNLAIGGVPKRLPITLNHLIYPVLSGICFRELDEVSFVLCLIKSSPNLAKLIIQACVLEPMVIDDPVLELLYAQEWSDISLNQLRRVHMYNISRTRSELEFIKLLLAKSSMLETMLIEPDW
ncbi:F-box/FBD/LRR-repeat protein At1g13570-like [Camellia sinensis]|uniref:F-box/FBD/LRR-repeat protein At1g13570-like n=1 Tax=Camellia sinensis TaxID=4442 RepID=UPI00103614A8|nr:F-box/FBD/LRR-repeat protein At1g13570-like [Camellia sinensis]